jgi:mRNA interferase MazF
MRRGEVWWAELPAPAGRRPVLLLSRDEAYLVRELVTVAPLTTRARKIPSEVPLGRDDGVPKTCVVNLDTITTIPRRTLTGRLTVLSPIKLAAVDRAVRFSLGLGEPGAR